MIDRMMLKDLAVEALFALGALILGGILILFLILAFIFPFHNYYPTSGLVEYDKEIPLTMEKAGVIYRILVKPDEAVRAGQPIIELLNQGNRDEIAALDYRLDLKHQEVERAKRLFQLGALEGTQVKMMETEEREILFQRTKLLTNTVKAPYDGYVYFTSSPQLLVGNFLKEGQTVAFLYKESTKGVRIVESSLMVDRLRQNAPIKVYLENSEVRHPQIRGIVEDKIIDRSQNTLSLYCTINNSREFFNTLPAGSSVRVFVLIGSKSLFESFFNIEVYGALKKRFRPGAFEGLEKWLN